MTSLAAAFGASGGDGGGAPFSGPVGDHPARSGPSPGVELVDTVERLHGLEGAWNELARQCPALSLYSTYDYTRIAWHHLSRPGERLFVLVVRDGSEVRAIAPFYIHTHRIRGLPVRTIDFIASWEGDKPSIVAPYGEAAAWEAIYHFLKRDFTAWDALTIREQPEDAELLTSLPFLHDGGFATTVTHDSTGYFIDLTGNWDDYLADRGSSVRYKWRRRGRALNELPGGLSVEDLVDPSDMGAGLHRLAALEKLSWKGAAGIGIDRTPQLRAFYEEFTRFMAERGQAAITFLRTGGQDLSCNLTYTYGGVVYLRLTAYDPAYGKLAPGIHLKAEMVRSLMGTGLKEVDEMGMHPSEGVPLFKVQWATRSLETRKIRIERKSLRMLPLHLGRRIKAVAQAVRPAAASKASVAASDSESDD